MKKTEMIKSLRFTASLVLNERLGLLASAYENELEKIRKKDFSMYRKFEFITEKSLSDYKAGSLSLEQAEKKMLRSYERKTAKKTAEVNGLFDRIKSAPDFESGKLEVEWRSCAWGMNPHAVFTAYGIGSTEGTASGCGYDKLSAASAAAFNASLSVVKALCEYQEEKIAEALSNGLELKDITTSVARDFFPYGRGYGYLPRFEGGVGIQCHMAVFGVLGFDMRQIASGKTYDVFVLERKKES